MQKELEMLSVQHTEKCLENSQLREELQDERKSMMQCQKENQELKKKQVDRLLFTELISASQERRTERECSLLSIQQSPENTAPVCLILPNRHQQQQ